MMKHKQSLILLLLVLLVVCLPTRAKKSHESLSIISFNEVEDEFAFVSASTISKHYDRLLEGEEEGDHEHEDHEHEDHEHEDHEHEEDEHEDEHGKKPWGEVIGFSILVNVATLSGILFLIPLVSKRGLKAACWNGAIPPPTTSVVDGDEVAATGSGSGSSSKSKLMDIFIPSFASGALLATSVFLVIPEGLSHIQKSLVEHEEEGHHDEHGEEENMDHAEDEDHSDHDHRFLRMLVEEEHEEESREEHGDEFLTGAIWRFGAAFLAGFILPIVFNTILPTSKAAHYEGDNCNNPTDPVDTKHEHEHEHEELVAQEDDDPKTSNDNEVKTTVTATTTASAAANPNINYSLAVSILLGDAFHNFCDGVFLGVGFMLCDKATAYTIFGITLYHEIAQELADYFLLTKHAGLKPINALALNFTSGLSVLLGGLIVLAVPVSDMLIGVVLSLAAGVYMYIAASECLPRVNQVSDTKVDGMWTILFFIIGVVPIGLALLNHSHCKEDGHAH